MVSRIPVVGSPEDPNKGQFGESSAEGLRLTATFPPNQNGQRYASFTLAVEPVDPSGQLNESVVFYLHPTFKPPSTNVEPVNNRAKLSLMGWGAFTVGAEVGGLVRLELDLARHADAPTPFRDR